MEFFITTLIAVATMLVYAVPGYISVKAKLIKPESISAFAVVLMYVCSPCLTVYSVNAVPVYTKELIIQIVGFFFISMAAAALRYLSCTPNLPEATCTMVFSLYG